MKHFKCHFVYLFLLPLCYSFELAKLDELDAEEPPLKTREGKSPHLSSEMFSGFFDFPFTGHHHHHHGSGEHGSDCPFPYKRVGDNCYYAKCTTTSTDELYWYDARAFCQTTIHGGGDLAVFDSANEFADAVRYIRSLDPTGSNQCDYWIGGYDNVTTNGEVWMWIDGSRMPQGVPYWNYNATSGPLGLLPTNPSPLHEVSLHYLSNYFFSPANGATNTYLPLCQIELDTKHRGHSHHGDHGHGYHGDHGHGYHGDHGHGYHEENSFGFPPHWRSEDVFSPQLRHNSPVHNSPLRSNTNNPFTRSSGNNPHFRRMPYVMNSQRRNLPIPGMFSGRKAVPNDIPQLSMGDNSNGARQSSLEIKDSILDNTKEIKSDIIDSEIKVEETKLQQFDAHESINDHQAEKGLMREFTKDSVSEVEEDEKNISTLDKNAEMLERKTITDEFMKESEADVHTNIEADLPDIQVKGEQAVIDLPVFEQKTESNKPEDAAINIIDKEQEDKFIKQEDGEISNPLNEHKGKVMEQVKAAISIPVSEHKDDLSEQKIDELIKHETEILVNEHKDDLIEQQIDEQIKQEADIPFNEHKDDLSEQQIDELIKQEAVIPVNEHKDDLSEQQIDELIKQEDEIPVNEQSDELVKQEAEIPVNEQNDELIKQEANIHSNEHKDEFRKEEDTQKEEILATGATKENENFNHVAEVGVSHEHETSEGKRSEFQTDDLNSYLPGMIYDIVSILQNIDRTYKPRFNIDRTEGIAH